MSRRPSLRDNLRPRPEEAEATPPKPTKKAAKAKQAAKPAAKAAAKPDSKPTAKAKAAARPDAVKSNPPPPGKTAPQEAAPEKAAPETVTEKIASPAADIGPAAPEPVPFTPAERPGREQRLAEGRQTVKRYSQWSAAAGLLPMPVLDTMALTATIIRMMAALNGIYRSHNDPGVARQAALTVIGVLGPKIAAVSTLKAIPGLGFAGLAVMPGMAAAAVWALGRLYLQHLDQGGSATDFDAQAAGIEIEQEMTRKDQA
ncbi:hypothetical protein [Oceanibaculum pacificum]|uniref:DUF697 domain-containing protein n=1 Tax=Oceanibaculum pacificum TaxID=580166 RepID=A0A154W3Z2_9PROT|nr:hypothetical protein [Oceanibaculum pacificum]KZD08177.1 hypothetical protein AUP43_08750 [Oceanibaculum pacificum]